MLQIPYPKTLVQLGYLLDCNGCLGCGGALQKGEERGTIEQYVIDTYADKQQF